MTKTPRGKKVLPSKLEIRATMNARRAAAIAELNTGDLLAIEIEEDRDGESITIFSIHYAGTLDITVLDIDDADPRGSTVTVTNAGAIQRAVDRLRVAISEYAPS